jgi:hypothetical protein
VGAAKERVTLFDTVTDNLAAAMVARRGQGMNGAFEGVEDMLPAAGRHSERLVIVVAAHFLKKIALSVNGKAMQGSCQVNG